jgi:two-component system, OmpR family, phosphate regulon sensor histidine kinase PhoR
MKSRRFIILFWVLLIVPAVIISVAAFKLLLHEQERINRSAITSLTERAETLAQSVHITIKEVEERLSEALIEIDSDQLESTLLFWEETNPLVRNVFIWEENTLLKYPVKGMSSTLEERQFINRFDAMFTGDKEFKATGNRIASEQAAPSYQSSKESLYDLARGKSAIPSQSLEQQMRVEGKGFSPQSGWIPWFAQDQLYILGWVKKTENGPVYGIELELISLLSRIVVDLPESDKNKFTFAILDSREQIVHLSGNKEVENAQVCDISTSLSGLLPHWQLCIFPESENPAQGKGFLYVSLLLLFIFMAAIISGGILLTIQTNKHMKDAMQKTSFVSSVSHELKTPLTSIRMYAELMLDGRSVSKEKTKHYLGVMVAQSQRLTRLINNILDFGKLEQDKKTYNKTMIDLKEILLGIIDAHGIRIKKEGFEIVTDIGKDIYKVVSDPDAVEQVILNLIDNALKYAVQGKYIGFALHNDSKGSILLKISDHGPGVPRKCRKAIFEKFYRVDNSLTSKFPGSGLGLSIARKILRDLGGDLTFEPVRKGGSCFIARIPIQDNKNEKQ